MAINRDNVRQYLQNFDFRTLFIEEMNWSNASGRPVTMTVEGTQYQRRPLAQLSGLPTFVLPIAPQGPKAETI